MSGCTRVCVYTWGSVHVCVCVCASHPLLLGGDVVGAVGNLGASVLQDVSVDRDVDHALLPAVAVGRLLEGQHTLGWVERAGDTHTHITHTHTYNRHTQQKHRTT